MPRARAITEEEKVEKNKVNARKGREGALGQTPRKKAAPKKLAAKKTTARKTTAKTEAKKSVRKTTTKAKQKAPAKKAIKKVEDEVEEVLETSEEVSEMAAVIKKRKAPTVFAGEAAKKRAFRTQAVVVCVLLTMGVGASVAVGFHDSDAGQINVEETIREQNARMANMVDVDGPTVVAPVPNRATIPDAGFIPSDDQSAQVKRVSAPAVASSTASSTTAVASSTDDGIAEQPRSEVVTGSGSAIDTATTTVTATDQSAASETESIEEESPAAEESQHAFSSTTQTE